MSDVRAMQAIEAGNTAYRVNIGHARFSNHGNELPLPIKPLTGMDAVRRKMKATVLARKLGVSASAISQWDGKVPVTRVAAVEAATGIPRHELRPDIFNMPSEAAQ